LCNAIVTVRSLKLPKLADNATLSAPADKEVGGTWLDFDHNSVRPLWGALDVWWEILSVLAPVVVVALLGTTVLYALSRQGSQRQ
jgi:hypothetical protein